LLPTLGDEDISDLILALNSCPSWRWLESDDEKDLFVPVSVVLGGIRDGMMKGFSPLLLGGAIMDQNTAVQFV
jgi:hypothetical protein